MSLTTQVTLSKTSNSSGPHLQIKKVDRWPTGTPPALTTCIYHRRNCLPSDLVTGLLVSIPFIHLPPKFSYEIQLCSYNICNGAYKTIHEGALCLLSFAYCHVHSFTHVFNRSLKKYLCILHCVPVSTLSQAYAVPLTHQAFLCLCTFVYTVPFARNALPSFSSRATLI